MENKWFFLVVLFVIITIKTFKRVKAHRLKMIHNKGIHACSVQTENE
jgi:hypothetical protein